MSKLIPPSLAILPERNDVLSFTIRHDIVRKLAFESAEKKILTEMAACKQESRVRVFRPSAHAYALLCCHVTFQIQSQSRIRQLGSAGTVLPAHCTDLNYLL